METTQLESTLDDVVQATQLDPESFLSPTREASQSLEQDAMALSSPRGKAPVAAETSTPARPGNGGALRNALRLSDVAEEGLAFGSGVHAGLESQRA